MQLEIFTVCDFAQSYGEKVVLSGPFNIINTMTFPFQQNMCVVGRICFDKEEDKPGLKKFKLRFLTPDKQEWIKPIEVNIDYKNENPTAYSNIICNMNQVVIKMEGEYNICLDNENENTTRTLKLFVNLLQPK